MSLQHGSNSIHLSPGNLVISGAGAILLSKFGRKISRKKTKKNLMLHEFFFKQNNNSRKSFGFLMDFIHVLGASHLGIRWNAEAKLLSWICRTSQLHISPKTHLAKIELRREERNELVKLLKKGLFWRGSTLSHGCSCSCSSKSWCCCCGCGMIESLYCW